MKSSGPKNCVFGNFRSVVHAPPIIPSNALGTAMVIPNKATRGTPYWIQGGSQNMSRIPLLHFVQLGVQLGHGAIGAKT